MERDELPERKEGRDREWRKSCLDVKTEFDGSMGSIPIKPGQYGPWKDAIVKNEDGSITFHKKMFPDDIVAFVITACANNPTLPKPLLNMLVMWVDTMDIRAMTKHGYSNSSHARFLDDASLSKKLFDLLMEAAEKQHPVTEEQCRKYAESVFGCKKEEVKAFVERHCGAKRARPAATKA